STVRVAARLRTGSGESPLGMDLLLHRGWDEKRRRIRRPRAWWGGATMVPDIGPGRGIPPPSPLLLSPALGAPENVRRPPIRRRVFRACCPCPARAPGAAAPGDWRASLCARRPGPLRARPAWRDLARPRGRVPPGRTRPPRQLPARGARLR